MMYRSVLSKTLLYIPRHEESSKVLAGSRLFLDQNGNIECEKTSDSLRALAATTNSPEITGVYDDDVFNLVSIGAGGSRNEAQAKEGHSGRALFGSSEKPVIQMMRIPFRKSVLQVACSMQLVMEVAMRNVTYRRALMTRVVMQL